LLWNIVDEILEIAGYPVAELTKEFGIKRKPKKKRGLQDDNSIVRNNNQDNAGGGK
jgi:hypothetical protein